VFSRFFLPQILFYGMSASAGAVLNMRGRFAAPMWAPLVNNVVVIAVTLAYLAIGGGDRPETLTASQTLLRSGGRLRARPGAVHRIYDPAVGSTPCRTPGPRR
jgi:putative peptidoglycan lipid II flippase